jgi:hypothetical protein
MEAGQQQLTSIRWLLCPPTAVVVASTDHEKRRFENCPNNYANPEKAKFQRIRNLSADQGRP